MPTIASPPIHVITTTIQMPTMTKPPNTIPKKLIPTTRLTNFLGKMSPPKWNFSSFLNKSQAYHPQPSNMVGKLINILSHLLFYCSWYMFLPLSLVIASSPKVAVILSASKENSSRSGPVEESPSRKE